MAQGKPMFGGGEPLDPEVMADSALRRVAEARTWKTKPHRVTHVIGQEEVFEREVNRALEKLAEDNRQILNIDYSSVRVAGKGAFFSVLIHWREIPPRG